ncbi:DUF1524 domain-containing protein [Gordonia sp. PKS22-38]|uniref:DUF1524 domain-containing protein n=1 Tax=Gordonia prachuapensis TaxID=3115651 RepID=A0ABU7MZ35_9ACTN|nr:DUF1524 domain-containing protein [Gordonia sp. PKS22-38]
MSAPPPPPGWNLDPSGSGRLRWWDGEQWTDRYHSPGATTTATRSGGKWLKIGGGVVAAIAVLAIIGNLLPEEEDTSTPVAAQSSTTTAPTTTTTSTTSAAPTSTVAAVVPLTSDDANAAIAKLDTLAVKGRAPKTGYDRDQFGQAWSDDVTVAGGHNGCDTRNDLLQTMDAVVIKPGTQNCVVLSGTLNDPYTGRSIPFTRGETTSTEVQVDHVVALSDAWQKGAQQLSADERRNLANDPRNLQPTDGPTNSQKGAGDAATWLPPNKSYRCTYVSRQIDVKAAYELWVTAAEKSAMQRVLSSCGATVPVTEETNEAVETEPYVDEQTRRAIPAAPEPEPTTPAYVPPPPPAPAQDATGPYENCTAARDAGAAPVYAGQPGYGSHLDSDGDGVGCES